MSSVSEVLDRADDAGQADTTNDWLAQADELAMRFKAVNAASAEIRFAIGDWLNKYADRDNVYDVGEDKFQKPRKQLVDYASTARRVPEALRKFNLSFNHYRVIANTAQPNKFSYWLEHAERSRPTCEDLRLTILAGSPSVKKITVFVPEEIYASLQYNAETNNSTVQDLASAWLKEKVEAEIAIKLKQPPKSDVYTPSPWLLQKEAERAEQRKEAQELYQRRFPLVSIEEFKRRWTAFLDADYMYKPVAEIVHIVTQEAERKERQAKQQAERQERQAKERAEREEREAMLAKGLRMCRELGLKTREETVREAGREASANTATVYTVEAEGKPLEKPTRLQFQAFTARCTKLCRDVLPKAGKEASAALLPFLRRAFGVQDLSRASVLQWEEVLARLEGAPNADAAYQIMKDG